MATQTRTRKPRQAKDAVADAPVAAPPSPPEPVQTFTFTADIARELQVRKHLTEFPLDNTKPGARAMVDPLDVQSASALLNLPEHLMVWALEAMQEVEQREGRSPVQRDDGSMDPQKTLEYLKREAELANEFCLMCFVEPKLVRTAEEMAAQPGTVHVEIIHPADRRHFLFWCLERRWEDANRVATFPAQ